MTHARVLVVDDEPDIRELVEEILADEGYAVATAQSAAQARERLAEAPPDLVLLDIWMPEEDGISLLKEWVRAGGPAFPVVMISGHGTVETAVEATRLGAVDFIEKPLSLGKLLATVEQALAEHPGANATAEPPQVLAPVGRSQLMVRLREQASRLAQARSPVLVTGEAGSGRKTLARYIHGLRAQPGPLVEFVPANAAGESMSEALFGRHGGRPGRLEAAAGGTLVIDELDDLDEAAQTRLTAVLDAGHFQRMGGGESVSLSCRVVAVASLELEAAVRAGRFREELFYQLNVVPVVVPPLRDHVEDIPELVAFFVDDLVEREGLVYRRFTVAAQNRLRNHLWPGNVRELRNLVQRLLLLGDGLDIDVDEVDRVLAERAHNGESTGTELWLDLPLREAREAFERAYLQRQLRRAEGSVAQLARLSGMERTHLYRKLRALGIDPKEGG
ncbi:sigma-54-dependent transcriptional regulator [Arhodomonas aquaeolei]|uniref:sigma-54-dependent transcriptional regulator n=1 Tax=Arhodomonas aquaeolei TaxID=2369 RepID=UPI000476CCF9|nr:sigma-54 dependent transcriptional regulator [Arhodomonas aquaeolei]